jgi:hypothetical protein
MKPKVFGYILAAGALGFVAVEIRETRQLSRQNSALRSALERAEAQKSAAPAVQPMERETPAVSEPARVTPPRGEPLALRTVEGSQPAAAAETNDKLARLSKVRESFRALAAGDHATAMRAAKQITDETERETALLELVTQWTHGQLGPSSDRARAIASFGLEAGLGMELARDPQTALLWANELTTGSGRAVLIHEVASAMVPTDPTGAFALAEQLPEAERGKFFTDLFASWGGQDTDAALQYAGQFADAADRDAAVAAIRTEAPVGIGTALAVKDGLPVVTGLTPGSPAEANGQLHSGDRILGVAQGDNAFVDTRNVPLADLVGMIRGNPGTTVQLQVLPSDAPPGTAPQTITIVRDQLKMKR